MPIDYIVSIIDSDGDWYDYKKRICVFSESTSSVSEEKPFALDLYPNPANDFIYIAPNQQFKNGAFELFDLRGKLVFHQLCSNSDRIFVGHIKKGMYMDTFSSENKKIWGKVPLQ